VGSIWLNSSVVDARDISIVTANSFFQGYQDGLISIAGNPFGSGTNISEEINEWFSEWLLFDGGKVSGSTLQGLLGRLAKDLKTAMDDFKRESGGMDYGTHTAIEAIKTAQERYDSADDEFENLLMQLGEARLAQYTDAVSGEYAFGHLKTDAGDMKSAAERASQESADIIAGYERDIRTEEAKNPPNQGVIDDLMGKIAAVQSAKAGHDADIKNWGDVVTLSENIILAEAELTLATQNWGKYESSVQIESFLNLQKTLNALQGKEFSGELLVLSLAGYNDAVIALQNAVSTDSWNGVFKTGILSSVPNIKAYLEVNLSPKHGRSADIESLISDYIESVHKF